MSLLVLTLTAQVVFGWGQYRGDSARTGVGEELPDKLLLRWKTTTGQSYEISNQSAPIIIQNNGVYYSCFGYSDGTIRAINNKTTGTQAWSYDTNFGSINPLSSGDVSGTYHIFAASSEGDFITLNAATGNEEWKIRIEGNITSSPLYINDTTVIVTANNGIVYKFDPAAQTVTQLENFESGGISGPCYLSAENAVCFGTEEGVLFLSAWMVQ